MKLECVREKISEAVNKAEKIASKNATLPILKCILLQAEKNSLVIRSTNLDIGIEIVIPAKVEVEGVVAVPGSILNSFLSHLNGEKGITIELKEGNLHISTPKTSTVIKAFPTEDYPSIPRIDGGSVFNIPADAFISGLKSVWYSSATSSIKPELSSVRVYPEDDFLVFVATDGFRLAEKRIKVKNVPSFSQVLIPVKNTTEIIRVFEGVDADLSISIDQNQLAITSDNTYVVSRTVEGNFPDYKAIIPKESSTEVTVLKQDIINILKLSTIFSDSFHHIKFMVHPQGKEVEIITKNNDVGENSSRIQAAVTGDSIDVNFNYRYISDSFQSVGSDSLCFYFNGATKPLVIRGVSDKTFMYLVMPMNR